MKIEFLKLFTANLEEQLHFYEQVLQLKIEHRSKDTFEVVCGYSRLKFQRLSSATPYHVAFHIPPHQEQQALQWLEERVEILKDEEDRIIDFPAWKAKSLYFYDADKNIIEFISRRDLFRRSGSGFSSESIIGISEIGLATEDVEDKFRFLNENIGLSKFTGDYEKFCATGDDEGLFIIINKHQKDWIPTGDKANSSEFEIKISVEKATFGAVYKNERLELL